MGQPSGLWLDQVLVSVSSAPTQNGSERAEGDPQVIKVIAACVIGAALAGGATVVATNLATESTATAEPVNETLYNYGDR